MGQDAVDHRDCEGKDGAGLTGAVVGEGAVGHHQSVARGDRATAYNGAAVDLGAVAGERAVGHGQCASVNVRDGAAGGAAVAEEGAVAYGHGASVVLDSATAVGIVAGERAVHHGRGTRGVLF